MYVHEHEHKMNSEQGTNWGIRWVHWWTCVFISLTASKWQLGQDRVWVQDTENSKTSHCGYCPRGHWRPGSRVRRRHRARVLLVKASAGKGSVEENPRTVELTADAISHVVHTSTEDCCGPVARYLLCLSTQFKTAKICFGIYMKNWFRKKKKIRIIPLSSCVCLTSSFVHFRGPKILPFNFAKEHRSFKLLSWLLFVSPERFHWNYDVCPTTTNFFRDFSVFFVFLLHCLNIKHLCGAIEETNTAAYAFAGAGIFSWEFWWTDVCI